MTESIQCNGRIEYDNNGKKLPGDEIFDCYNVTKHPSGFCWRHRKQETLIERLKRRLHWR